MKAKLVLIGCLVGQIASAKLTVGAPPAVEAPATTTTLSEEDKASLQKSLDMVALAVNDGNDSKIPLHNLSDLLADLRTKGVPIALNSRHLDDDQLLKALFNPAYQPKVADGQTTTALAIACIAVVATIAICSGGATSENHRRHINPNIVYFGLEAIENQVNSVP